MSTALNLADLMAIDMNVHIEAYGRGHTDMPDDFREAAQAAQHPDVLIPFAGIDPAPALHRPKLRITESSSIPLHHAACSLGLDKSDARHISGWL
jgi:hypothetical protein